MGLVPNILTRVYVQALRGGHAKDVAHLEAKSGQGLATNEVCQSLGHTERSYQNGTTQKYIGDPTQLLYNDRVQNQWVDPLAPQFGSTSAHAVVKAYICYRSQRIASTTGANGSKSQVEESNAPESPTKDKVKVKSLRQKSATEINAMPEVEKIDMTIDPRLLSEGMFEDSVDQGKPDSLENMLFLPTGSSQTAQLEDFAAQGHLKDMDNNLSATDFIGLYSTINVSTNTNFAKTWNKLKEQNKDHNGSIEPVMPLGNSRDLPTPFVHHCKTVEGCTFETIVHGHLLTHQTICTEEKVEKLKVMASLHTKFECTHCHQRFETRRQLRYHLDMTHLWVPKRCDAEGCDSTEVFATSLAFNRHKKAAH